MTAGIGDTLVLGTPAYTALWIGFIIFLVQTLRNRDKKKDVFFYLSTSVVMIASLAYLVMALGRSHIVVAGGREFLWVRYADWTFTTPLLLIDLGLLAGITVPEIFFLVVCDLIMVAAGFAGAVSAGTNATWPLFVFGCVAFIPILHFLAVKLPARAPAAAKKAFQILSWLTIILWSAYPIIWGTGEGGQNMSPDSETICYAVLDVTAKCVFGFILLSQHDAMEAAPGLINEANEETGISLPLLSSNGK